MKHTKAARSARASGLLLGLVLLSGCSTSSSVASRQKFTEADSADFIAKYYSDQTSYVLKPPTKDGPYQSICDRARLLTLARQQPGRELAVIVLTHYPSAESEEPVKVAWVNDLTGLGYRRIVFLRGGRGLQVNRLTVLAAPQAPPVFAGK